MKVVGAQIKSDEVIIVVLEQDENGNVIQTKECVKLSLGESKNPAHVKQFRDQVNITFDSVSPDKIGILSRNARGIGQNAPSPLSFKLEGIIQLYEKVEVQLIAPQTIAAFLKKNEVLTIPKFNYQTDALNLAYYLLKQK